MNAAQSVTQKIAAQKRADDKAAILKKNSIHEYERLMTEDAIAKIPNRFDMILCASQRARQLHAKYTPTVDIGSRENVTAIREIAAGNVGREMLLKV